MQASVLINLLSSTGKAKFIIASALYHITTVHELRRCIAPWTNFDIQILSIKNICGILGNLFSFLILFAIYSIVVVGDTDVADVFLALGTLEFCREQ
jgi:hypothetical protein